MRTPGKLGIYPNIDADAIKIQAMLGTHTPSCTSTGTAPSGQDNYPSGPTMFGAFPVASNTGFASDANINIPLPRCEPFNSDVIRATYTPRWTAGTRTIEPKIDVPRSYCERVIAEGTPTYIPAGASMAYLNAQVGKTYWLFGLTPFGDCSLAFARYMCARVFMPCTPATRLALAQGNVTDVSITLTVPLPSFPCRTVCTDFAQKCATFIE